MVCPARLPFICCFPLSRHLLRIFSPHSKAVDPRSHHRASDHLVDNSAIFRHELASALENANSRRALAGAGAQVCTLKRYSIWGSDAQSCRCISIHNEQLPIISAQILLIHVRSPQVHLLSKCMYTSLLYFPGTLLCVFDCPSYCNGLVILLLSIRCLDGVLTRREMGKPAIVSSQIRVRTHSSLINYHCQA